MNWHHPDLYFFLSLLAGIAALLAIIYEIFSRRRKPPVILMKALPLDGLNESGPWSKPMTGVADLALPAYLKVATPLDEFLLRDRSALTRLRNRFRRRFTPERNHNPWKKNYSPPRLSRYRLNKYSVIIGAFAVLFVKALSAIYEMDAAAAPKLCCRGSTARPGRPCVEIVRHFAEVRLQRCHAS
ncbi:MAG: hypothetical protein WBM12_16410 [Pseudolabrys sp.]